MVALKCACGGTEIRVWCNGGTRRSGSICYARSIRYASLLAYAYYPLLSAYAPATRCPVLTQRAVLVLPGRRRYSL
eukprot:2191920-Rhodomonas_salina.1